MVFGIVLHVSWIIHGHAHTLVCPHCVCSTQMVVLYDACHPDIPLGAVVDKHQYVVVICKGIRLVASPMSVACPHCTYSSCSAYMNRLPSVYQ